MVPNNFYEKSGLLADHVYNGYQIVDLQDRKDMDRARLSDDE